MELITIQKRKRNTFGRWNKRELKLKYNKGLQSLDVIE
jgi:hypothetical protein